MVKIDKGIPSLNGDGRGDSPGKINRALSTMNAGDSFLVEGAKSTQSCKDYDTAKQWAHRRGRKIAGRAVEGGLRIWLVS